MISTDNWLRIISGMMVNAVIFGVGAVTVLSIPALASQAKYLLPIVVAASFAIAPLIAIPIARRMRLRNWGRRHWVAGDSISG